MSHVRDQKIWKISPGKNAVYWSDFKEQGIIAIGWEEFGDIREIGDKTQLREITAQKISYSDTDYATDQGWAFYKGIKEDDIVVAFGKGSLLDIGKVVGEYFFDDSKESSFHDGYTFPHRKNVEWFNVFDKPLEIRDDEKMYHAFRWPQDTIHEIVDVDIKRRIRDFISGKRIIPSKTHILRAIEELREVGKIKIRKDELFKKLVKIVEAEEKKKLKTNWQAETWKRIRELAERVVGE